MIEVKYDLHLLLPFLSDSQIKNKKIPQEFPILKNVPVLKSGAQNHAYTKVKFWREVV